MKNIYEEPKLDVIKFNVKEPIMMIDSSDPAGVGNASEPMNGSNPFPENTYQV